MTYNRVIHPKAAEDIFNIIKHYRSIKAPLAKEFLKKLRVNYTKISNNPRICQVRYGESVRLSHLKKFHYSIHYFIDEEQKQIIVLAVFSMRENPQKWEKRFARVHSQ